MIRYIHSIYAFMSYDLIDQYRDKQQEVEFVEKDNLLRGSFFMITLITLKIILLFVIRLK